MERFVLLIHFYVFELYPGFYTESFCLLWYFIFGIVTVNKFVYI